MNRRFFFDNATLRILLRRPGMPLDKVHAFDDNPVGLGKTFNTLPFFPL
jgi:hypothetical protein